MFNWRSFATFLKLRNHKDAQKEIREIASEMLRLVENIEGKPFEHTISAFKAANFFE
jgi:thymidylate synthase ThyX